MCILVPKATSLWVEPKLGGVTQELSCNTGVTHRDGGEVDDAGE